MKVINTRIDHRALPPFDHYILTADRITYDRSLNKFTAEGNAQLKDPNGAITKADRLEATDEIRDAFVARRLSCSKLLYITPDSVDLTAPTEIDASRNLQ
jgi:hypothetical protein